MPSGTVRQAREDDYEAVVAFTERTWEDRDEGDYVPDVFLDWVASDGPAQRTMVVEVEGDIAGLCQAVLLSEYEAWLQGMRVNPAYRGNDIGRRLNDALFEWAVEGGATVARNLVFSWNEAGLGQSVAAGFSPVASFRWAEPEPEPATSDGSDVTVESDPAAAWSYWTRSDARTALSGLGLDPGESWSLSEVTRERFHRLADEEAVFAVKRDGTCAASNRIGTRTGETEEGTVEVAEYGVAGWTDSEAADALFAAIREDAAGLGADQTRVLIPETPRHVAEAATVRAEPSDWPSFVFEADLTRR